MDELGVDVSVVFTYDGLLRPTPDGQRLARRLRRARRRSGWSRSRPSTRATRAPAPRSSAASREHGMRGVKLHPWLQGFSAHEPGLQDRSARRRPSSGCRSSSTTARRRSRRRSSSRRSRGDTRRRRWCSGHGGLHDLWREAIAAVLTTDERPPLHVRARPATRCGRSSRAARSSGCSSAPMRACGPSRCRATPCCASASSTSSASTRRSARRSSTTNPRRLLARMIDVHTHVPTHRDRVPAGRADRQHEMASRPRGGGDDDLGRLRGGIRGRRGLGRLHDRPRPRRGSTRRSTTPSPPSSPRRPSAGSASSRSTPRSTGCARTSSSGRARTSGSGDQARPELPGLRPARRRRRCASTSSPSATACRSSSTRAPRRCGTRRSATPTRC